MENWPNILQSIWLCSLVCKNETQIEGLKNPINRLLMFDTGKDRNRRSNMGNYSVIPGIHMYCQKLYIGIYLCTCVFGPNKCQFLAYIAYPNMSKVHYLQVLYLY